MQPNHTRPSDHSLWPQHGRCAPPFPPPNQLRMNQERLPAILRKSSDIKADGVLVTHSGQNSPLGSMRAVRVAFRQRGLCLC